MATKAIAICARCKWEFKKKKMAHSQIYCSLICCKRQWDSDNRQKSNASKYKWRANHPEAAKAYNYVQYHKIPLAKQCQWPGCYETLHLHRHHHNYNNPGCVLTVCPRHHKYIYAQKRKLQQQDLNRGQSKSNSSFLEAPKCKKGHPNHQKGHPNHQKQPSNAILAKRAKEDNHNIARIKEVNPSSHLVK